MSKHSVIVKVPALKDVLRRHAIHPSFWDEFRALVERGKRPSKALLTRLDCVDNYKAALDEVMAELSKPLGIVFPPV